MRYISLLIVSGLMIPITIGDTCVYLNHTGIEQTVTAPACPTGNGNPTSFSFLHDVLEKLLPAVSFLK